ncbi:MAG: efflux RND transporter periplasmic adaptor subunit, partial [Stenotrophobium sp.]
MTRILIIAIGLLTALAAGYLVGHDTARVSVVPVAAGQTAAPASPAADEKSDTGSVTTDTAFNPDFVKTAMPVQQTVPDTIFVTGKLALDAQRVRLASARVAGRLGRIFVFEGQSVTAGQPLAEIYSPDYISAENEFLLALRFRDALSKDHADAELRSDTEATYQSAANRLKVLGASNAEIAQLARTSVVSQYFNIRAPITGVVTKRNVDPGAYLNVGDTLMSLANVDTLWLFANTYEPDYSSLKLGEALEFQTAALPGRTFTGHVAFIAPSLDPATHTLAIRCDVPNTNMLLRPEMFISGQLKVAEQTALLVPRQAIFHIRDSDYVFVQDNDKHYQRVKVQGRPVDSGQYAVTGGLTATASVVVDGTVLL